MFIARETGSRIKEYKYIPWKTPEETYFRFLPRFTYFSCNKYKWNDIFAQVREKHFSVVARHVLLLHRKTCCLSIEISAHTVDTTSISQPNTALKCPRITTRFSYDTQILAANCFVCANLTCPRLRTLSLNVTI